MLTDPIADFLTRIRNAQRAGQDMTSCPASRMKVLMLEVMKKNKYIEDFKVDGRKIEIYFDTEKMNLNLKRVSKPGQRIYANSKSIKKVLNGLGISIISTSEGLMTGYEARKRNLGGEILCEIY